MSSLIRFGVSIEDELLESFDELSAERGYSNRSEAVRDLMRDALVQARVKAHPDKTLGATYYICDYLTPHTITAVEKMFCIKGGIISGPMGGTIAAFASKDSAIVYNATLQGEMTTWAAGTR